MGASEVPAQQADECVAWLLPAAPGGEIACDARRCKALKLGRAMWLMRGASTTERDDAKPDVWYDRNGEALALALALWLLRRLYVINALHRKPLASCKTRDDAEARPALVLRLLSSEVPRSRSVNVPVDR